MTNKLKDTIFVAIACMDDKEITYTVNSIFENSTNPKNIFVGIGLTAQKSETLRSVKALAKKYNNLKFSFTKQKKNGIKTIGVGKGRFKAESLYNGQDYFVQVDAHSHFEKDWDVKVLDLFFQAKEKAKSEKVVLTCIPPRFHYNEKGVPTRSEKETRYPRFVPGMFVGAVPMWQSINSLDLSKETIIPSPKANSAFLFGDAEFAKNTGVVSTAIFYDEEILYSINLFGRGYSFAFPNVPDFPVMHLDGDQITKGHEREFFIDYLDKKHSDILHSGFKNHYWSFLDNPKNKEKVKLYKDYAKIDLKRGHYSTRSDKIPSSFR
jgi:hypothetical protein